ncbi:DUF222 domain-containing protein [Microbacterium invictum]|uniref:HNH nuclease domain-containing protein n=1 Tax=Microbacterium invictum TaxID=515415 RepID=A0AA40SPJ7_9MICO|nr:MULTISPECIES: DUF222 domain-containing protein [Microbacterium]MBB4140062.1 hypothetical protein [Microbacterium invictum]
MTFIDDLRSGIDRLSEFAELDVETTALLPSVCELSDNAVRAAFDTVANHSRNLQKLELALAGVIAQRSSRAAGHKGLAQTGGYRTPEQMVREITGVPKSEAVRVVRVGSSLLDAEQGAGSDDELDVDAGAAAPPAREPWHRPLRDALLNGAITQAQHDVIRRGLGEPPAVDGRDEAEIIEVWRVAARRLVAESADSTVEDLAAAARAARDLIDPVGAELRWQERHAKRSFRMRVDADGLRHGHLVFDDEDADFWQSVLDSAMRPRRGGPRFVSEDEAAAARDLLDDPRTNDQMAYDLITDVFRAGALAEAKDVFGARQAGVRLVTIKDAVGPRDAFGRLLAVAHTEDGRVSLPGSALDRALCTTGSVEVIVDACGNPLDLGRKERLFSARQRLAIAARDGGCMWPGCERPIAYSEVHHIDHWHEHHGKTDVDRGILLCRYHHLLLHNAGWKITRVGKGEFLLHRPPGTAGPPIPLRSKSPLRWLFDPPPRTGWRTAA